MKEQAEIHRLNYAMAKHHRELLHEQIDSNLIQQIELSSQPSLNYKQAFKNVYHEQLEKSLLQQKQKQETYMRQQPIRNSTQSAYESQKSYNLANNLSYSTFKNPIVDYENTKKESLVQRQLNQGHSFFKSQDKYLQRRDQEKKATRQMLQQQLIMKEKQKFWANWMHNKEVQQAKENRKRQVETQIMANERTKEAKYKLGEEIKQQIKDGRMRKQNQTVHQSYKISRHNPITNPIQYHIDNPYILQKMKNQYGSDKIR